MLDTKMINGLLEDLKQSIAEDDIPFSSMGICANVATLLYLRDRSVTQSDINSCRRTVSLLCKNWPECSGNFVYPVSHPEYEDPREGYNMTDNVWEGAYGAARLRLLDFLIQQTETES